MNNTILFLIAATIIAAGMLFLHFKPWRSRLVKVPNRARRFGEADEYFALDVMHNGTPASLLLTESEVETAIRRGVKQPEDSKLSAWLAVPFIAAVCFCFVACKPASSSKTGPSYPPPTRILDQFDIAAVMSGSGIRANSFAVPDAKYILPTRRWIDSDFSSGLWQFQHEMGIARWESESNDCDKFAIAASFYAKWLNHSSPNRNVDAGLAFGELYYLKSGLAGQGHAINFFIALAGDSIQLVCYEPQTRSVVELSPAEKQSVFFWKL